MFEQPFSALSVCAQVPFQTNSSAVSAFTPGPVGARDSEPGHGGQEPGVAGELSTISTLLPRRSANVNDYQDDVRPATVHGCRKGPGSGWQI